MTKDERIKELEEQIKVLEARCRKMRLDFLAHAQAVTTFAQTMNNLQPVIGRLLTVAVVLEKKGVYTQEDIITEEEANKFIAQANPEFAAQNGRNGDGKETKESVTTPDSKKLTQEMPSKPESTRPMDSNHGDGSAELSRAPSNGGIIQGDFTPQGRTGDTNIPAIRGSNGSGDGATDTSKIETKDISSPIP